MHINSRWTLGTPLWQILYFILPSNTGIISGKWSGRYFFSKNISFGKYLRIRNVTTDLPRFSLRGNKSLLGLRAQEQLFVSFIPKASFPARAQQAHLWARDSRKGLSWVLAFWNRNLILKRNVIIHISVSMKIKHYIFIPSTLVNKGPSPPPPTRLVLQRQQNRVSTYILTDEVSSWQENGFGTLKCLLRAWQMSKVSAGASNCQVNNFLNQALWCPVNILWPLLIQHSIT